MRFSIQYSTIGELRIREIRVPSLYFPVALLWYDYALTWTREVKYFWTRPFTLSTLMYIFCRYGMVANVLYTLALAKKLPTMRVRFVEVPRMITEQPCTYGFRFLVFDFAYDFLLWPDVYNSVSLAAMQGIEFAQS
jgi:hypothetical protein